MVNFNKYASIETLIFATDFGAGRDEHRHKLTCAFQDMFHHEQVTLFEDAQNDGISRNVCRSNGKRGDETHGAN
jgi:hypothetical protein